MRERTWNASESSGIRRTALILVLLLLALSCSDDHLQRVTGELSVQTALDFGAIAIGRRGVQRITLKNVGPAPLTVAHLSFDQPGLADFGWDPPASVTLAAGDSVDVPVFFHPLAVGKRGVRLHLATDSSRTPDARVELLGEGILANAGVGPATLDFGKVAVQTSRTLPLTLTNRDSHTAEVRIGDLRGPDAAFFSASPAGTVLVPPKSTRTVDVRFAPMRLGDHTATLAVQPCPSCVVQPIALKGTGIQATLVAVPPSLDFGYTVPKSPATLKTTITNEGSAPVTITLVNGGKDTAPEYTIAGPPTPFVVQPNGSFDVNVTFSPITQDKKTGTVHVHYGADTWKGELRVPLTGTGGGPRIQVVPEALGFPRTAVGLFVDKRIAIRNVGIDPAQPLQLSNLPLAVTGDAQFSVIAQPNPTLQPSQTTYVTIRFAPLVEGPASAMLKILSNDPDHPEVDVPITASASKLGPCTYEVTPPQLSFGAVAVGTTAELAFRVTNVGTNTCAIANVKLSDTTPPEFGLTTISSRLIDPGQSLVVPVEFQPDSDQAFQGEAMFDASSPTQPHAVVPLNAMGRAPCLEVVPDHLDFGAVGLACQPPMKSVDIRNNCSLPVTITGISIGAGASTAFAIDHVAGAQVLQPGDDELVSVVYAPKVAGDDVAPLFVQTDMGPQPVLVPLIGHAQARPTQTDTFDIPYQNKVDFLFVVDNSGSMQDKQDAIARNFGRFINVPLGNHTDFHIAVTTTGLAPYRGGWADCPGGAYGGEAGRFFPVDNSTPRILTPQTPGLKAAFANDVHVGICHWWEEGLEGMRLALTPPLVDHPDDPNTPQPNDGNAGFLRPDASLYVLWVSDANDSDSYDVNRYVQFLLSLKPGRPDLVSASAVVGLPTCSTIESVGTRYIQVVNAMGGIVADICSPDWGGILEQIGHDAFDPPTTFPLTRAPDGRDIHVAIDGNEIPQNAPDGSMNWHFDPSIGLFGAVIFDNGRGPGPNTQVEVTYPVPCPPA